MSINQRVFELLGSQKSKQIELAKALGISASTLNSWKLRGSDPPARYIYAIANFFSVSIEYILLGNDMFPAHPALQEDETALLKIYRTLQEDGRTLLLAKAYQEQRRLSTGASYQSEGTFPLSFHESPENDSLQQKKMPAAKKAADIFPKKIRTSN